MGFDKREMKTYSYKDQRIAKIFIPFPPAVIELSPPYWESFVEVVCQLEVENI